LSYARLHLAAWVLLVVVVVRARKRSREVRLAKLATLPRVGR
jgi:hypothetical protein